MNAVILAAGIGSRLGQPLPRCLLKLPSGESLLSRQIQIMKAEGISEIKVVIGFEKELVMAEIPDVKFVYNPDYQTTSTSKSLLLALKGNNKDVLLANRDLMCDQEVLAGTKLQNHNSVVINNARCGEEEVKYRLNNDNNIIEISKKVKDAQGEALGINLVMKNSLRGLIDALEQCENNDYFERAIQILIDRDVVFKGFNVSRYRCIEIDFEEDWQKALKMFS